MARHNDAQDLHLWSIYRQNLNADLSESARVGCSTRSNASERPFGHFQLKEQTVSAILNHPKYGPRLKHPDATHYLQFGLPRVQTHGIRQNHSSSSMLHPNHRPLSPTLSSQSPPIDRTDRAARSSAAGVNLSHFRLEQSQANTNERSNRIVRDIESIAPHRSARRRDESFVETRSIVDVPRRVTTPVAMHSKRLFRSNPNLLDSNRILTNDVNTIINPQSSRVASPVDSSRMDMSGPLMRASWPHLLVRSLYFELDRTSSSRRLCGAQRQKVRVIDNVSFEVRAGDVLGIMSPNEQEGSAVLEVLAGRHRTCRCRAKSELFLNGMRVTSEHVARCCGYACSSPALCPRMSTRQTLLFESLLRSAGVQSASHHPHQPTHSTHSHQHHQTNYNISTKRRVDALLEQLALSDVRHTSVGQLSPAERTRLSIALQLLVDPTILLLDQPLSGCDLFDSFFLLEFLRRWAASGPRAVILNVRPPTHETFCMLSHVLLLSGGKTIFYGSSNQADAYFASVHSSCPPFRNPSDFWVDLATPDAPGPSCERVQQLLLQHVNRLEGSAGHFLQPPRATSPPVPVQVHSLPLQLLALCIRSLIFTFPYNVIYLFRSLLVALALSILAGVLFWHVRLGREQEQVWDRVYFYHALLGLMPVPLFLVQINELHNEKQWVLHEIKSRLYRPSAYFLSNTICSMPGAILTSLTYSLPANSMAAQKPNLLHYIAVITGYMLTMRFFGITLVWACRRKSSALITFMCLQLLMVITSAASFHHKDLTFPFRILQWLFPLHRAFNSLLNWEFGGAAGIGVSTSNANVRFTCSHNPIIQQENAILIKADCGLESRDHILKWFNITTHSLSHDLLFFALASTFFLIASVVSFGCCARTKHRSWSRKLKTFH